MKGHHYNKNKLSLYQRNIQDKQTREILTFFTLLLLAQYIVAYELDHQHSNALICHTTMGQLLSISNCQIHSSIPQLILHLKKRKNSNMLQWHNSFPYPMLHTKKFKVKMAYQGLKCQLMEINLNLKRRHLKWVESLVYTCVLLIFILSLVCC